MKLLKQFWSEWRMATKKAKKTIKEKEALLEKSKERLKKALQESHEIRCRAVKLANN